MEMSLFKSVIVLKWYAFNMLGGLAVMANLRDEDKNLILGALLSLRSAIDENDDATLRRLRDIGAQAFLAKKLEKD